MSVSVQYSHKISISHRWLSCIEKSMFLLRFNKELQTDARARKLLSMVSKHHVHVIEFLQVIMYGAFIPI